MARVYGKLPDDPTERAQQIQEILELTLRNTVAVMNPPRFDERGNALPKPGPELLMRSQLAAEVTIIQALAFLVEAMVPEASVTHCRETLELKFADTQGES